jgi:hypothetical protein
MKYNFHELKEKIKKDKSFLLPNDVNEPVYSFLKEQHCDGAIGEAKKLEARAGYGEVVSVHDDVPNASLSFNVECGMICQIKIYELVKAGKWSIYVYRTIKNKNIDKKNNTIKKELDK